MDETSETPILLQLLFGEAAGAAGQTASPRLRLWRRRFEGWLEEQRRTKARNTYTSKILVWKRLLGRCRVPPWELTPADLEGLSAWMKEEGYAASTIAFHLSTVSSFFRWRNKQAFDPECEQGFNPARGASRPKVEDYGKGQLFSREEAQALLGILEQDKWILSKRDHAFFTCRLLLGIPNKRLQSLQWGQIEQDQEGRWVELGAGKSRVSLDEEAWEAIATYLRAAGRLSGERSPAAEAYIFAPLADPMHKQATGKAEEWDEGRYVHVSGIGSSLKRYGKLAGIGEEKLSIHSLRHTAVARRIEAGASVSETDVFLGSPGKVSTLNYRWAIRKLMRRFQEREEKEADFKAEAPQALPERKPGRFVSEDAFKHGYYATSQPPQELAEILAEDIQGVEGDIVGMRILARCLDERLVQAKSRKELADLAEASTRARSRVAELIKFEKQLKEGGKENSWAEELLAALNDMLGPGKQIDVEAEREAARAGDPELSSAARSLKEEIASTRLVLRTTFREAMATQDHGELLCLANVYGMACGRLVRLLKVEDSDQGRLADHLNEVIDQAKREILVEWGRGDRIVG